MRKFLIFGLLLFAPMAYGQGEDLDEPGLYAIFDTTQGEFIIELFYEQAPKTVANFVNLVQGKQDWKHPVTGEVMKGKRFYDGLIFHRIIDKFMIQGGDPAGNGTGGPGYTINPCLGSIRTNSAKVCATTDRGFCRWQTGDRTPAVHSSLSRSRQPQPWTASMPSSDRFTRA